MPIIYVNGSAPNYLGATFNTSAELLTLIRNNLVSAGWTAVVDNIPGNTITMRGVTEVNAHQCWMVFTTSVVSGNLSRLTIRGDLDGTGVTLSPNAQSVCDYDTSLTNYLYLAADRDAGCICVVSGNASQPLRGQHFGFVNRVNNADDTACYIGPLNPFTLGQTYVMRSGINNTVWRQLSADWLNVIASTAHAMTSAIWIMNSGSCDFVNASINTAHGGGISFNNANNDYPMYMLGNGQVNAETGTPLLAPYYYVEGRGATNTYGNTSGGSKAGIALPPPLFFRGTVKFAYRGLASLLEGEQVIASDGSRYLSTGSIGWQGFRIKAAD
jgi:hypothetical protein